MDLLIISSIGFVAILTAFYGRIQEEKNHIDQVNSGHTAAESSDLSNVVTSKREPVSA